MSRTSFIREPQPRGAKARGNKPINQSEAADRFIAGPHHPTMHDERLWGHAWWKENHLKAKTGKGQ